jgi:hypothetical protein
MISDTHLDAAEFCGVAASLKDPQLRYYTDLYLGYECEMLSRPVEARIHFEQAAALYPKAQSPLLALSNLAHSSGDNQAAFMAIQRMLMLPDRDDSEDDPWWNYDLSHVRDSDALLAVMRKALGGD